MLRSPNVHYKSSDLFSILREHFGKDMNLARIKAMSMMICALCKVQRIAYTKLASSFDNEAGAGSSLRRIQRLIAECVINTDLIAKLILKLIPVKGPYSLSLDRTNWKFSDTNINILTLGITRDGMAFPIVFKMMDKRGNSSTEERKDLITRFIWHCRRWKHCSSYGRQGVCRKWLARIPEFQGNTLPYQDTWELPCHQAWKRVQSTLAFLWSETRWVPTSFRYLLCQRAALLPVGV